MASGASARRGGASGRRHGEWKSRALRTGATGIAPMTALLTGTTPQRRSHAPGRWSPTHRSQLLIGVVMAIAVLGGGLSLQMLAGHEVAGSIGKSQRTSFGTVSVQSVEVLNGLSEHDLGGGAHGVQGLVTSGRTSMAVAVRLSNTSDRPVRFAPEEFRLRAAGAKESVRASAGSLQPGVLLPGASIDGRLAFVIKPVRSDHFVEFDNEASQPVRIDVGPSDQPQPDHTH